MIGSYQLIQTVRKSKEEAVPVMATVAAEPKVYKTLMRIQLNVFGLVIQVLKTPDVADMDGSGTIRGGESILLGVALALDTFAAGMAATMTGVPHSVIGFVAVMQIIMIGAGQGVAGRLPLRITDKAKYIPGVVLLIIGLFKMGYFL
jgi:putative sporulation protein YtaF